MNLRKQTLVMLTAIATLALFSTNGVAQSETTQEQVRTEEQIQQQKRIYGSQVMTEQERNEYRGTMRQATSQEERERIRTEHHKQMKERAKVQGITLPDEPPAGGMGQGMGRGQELGSGREMGRGQGMGPGGRMGGGSKR